MDPAAVSNNEEVEKKAVKLGRDASVSSSKSIDDILETLGAKNQQQRSKQEKSTDVLASADYSDVICAACELGGDMICCDGRCLRSFHPSCIDLNEEDIPEDSPFLCVDCTNGIHRCFACKHFEIESDMVKCSVPFCGKYYHKKVCQFTFLSFFLFALYSNIYSFVS